MSLPVPDHGGDLRYACQIYGRELTEWLDLSTGINPHSYPLFALANRYWRLLPCAKRLLLLNQTVARFYGPAPDAQIVAAAGIQHLLCLLAGRAKPGRLAVLSPCYSEYATIFATAGWRIVQVEEPQEGLSMEAMVLGCPNNPDGRIWSGECLSFWAQQLASKKNGFLAVDGAFADAVDKDPIMAKAGGEGLILLRSFGKFFGLGGVRLGFALCEGKWAQYLRKMLGPWPVCAPVIEIAIKAYADQPWVEQTRRQMGRDAEKLKNMLQKAGFQLRAVTPYFCLVAHQNAASWHENLARQGIWVRKFHQYPHLLRFGIIGDAKGWRRLEQALSAP